MESRIRVEKALNHEEPDRVPLDLGGSAVTGMHVSTVYKLRQAMGLDPPGTPVKVTEPFQMLGEIKTDIQEALGVDVVGLISPKTMFGYEYTEWKPWTTFDGTPVLVPIDFNTEPNPDGSIPMYAKGDRDTPASAWMPKDGHYFDATERQGPLEWKKLDIEDNTLLEIIKWVGIVFAAGVIGYFGRYLSMIIIDRISRRKSIIDNFFFGFSVDAAYDWY